MNRSTPAGGWSAWLAIARRDLLEFIRDRRALFITLVMPMLMYPLLALSSTLGVRTAVLELERRETLPRLVFAFSGADAEAFAIRLESLANGPEGPPDGWPREVLSRVVDPQEAISLIDEGAADVWIDMPRASMATLDGTDTLPVDVRLSTVRPPDRRVRQGTLDVLRDLADATRLRRLQRAGLPETLLEPLRVRFMGDAPQTSVTAVREMMPMAVAAVLVLLSLLTATGAFYPAIDAIAGEKERGTIETLLIAPCSTFDIVTGKFGAVFVVTLATLVANGLSIALTATVLRRFLPAGVLSGMPVGDLLALVGLTLAAYVGLASVAAALCLTVTAASKSAKEAQNTLTPVVMLIAALSGSALLPGSEQRIWLPAVPFAGQVAVAKSMLATFFGTTPADGGAVEAVDFTIGLAVSVASSGFFTWLLLLVTSSLVANEEILFRGPDAATRGFRRPPRRERPSLGQGIALIVLGLASLWYAQGLAPASFVPALIVQQAVAVVAPLVVMAWWQRTSLRSTLSLSQPAEAPVGWAAMLAGPALVGSGLFVVGAAAALAVWGGTPSPEAKQFAAQIVRLIQGGPPIIPILILAVMPAVCEEVFFRGWVLSAFAGTRPRGRRAILAVVAQAAAFAAFHLLPERMPQTFALGLVAGWITLVTGSLLPAIIAHIAHNATPVLLVMAASPESLDTAPGGSFLPPWAVAAAVASLLVGGWLITTFRRHRTEDQAWTPAALDDVPQP